MSILFLHSTTKRRAQGPAPIRVPLPAFQYLFNASALGGDATAAVPNTGTAGPFTLVNTAGPIALATSDSARFRAFSFNGSGSYFQSQTAFPVVKNNGPRTFYLVLKLDTDQAGDLTSIGRASYAGGNFSISYDGENDQSTGAIKLVHVAMAGLDMKASVLSIGNWITLVVQATPLSDTTCRITIINDLQPPQSQDFRYLDTDPAPLLLGSGTWNNRAADSSIALLGIDLAAEAYNAVNNKMRQVQQALGLPARELRVLLNDYNPGAAGGVLYDGAGKVRGLKDFGTAGLDIPFVSGTAAQYVAADAGNGYPCLELAEDSYMNVNYPSPLANNGNRNYTIILVCRFLGIRQQYQFPISVYNAQSFLYLSYGDVRSHWGLGYGGTGNINTNGSLFGYALSGVDENGNGYRTQNRWYQSSTGQVLNLDEYGDGGSAPLVNLQLGSAWYRIMRVKVYSYQMTPDELATEIAQIKATYPKMPL